jgi:hypothetical protein
MNVDERLRDLIEAERGTSIPPRAGVEGWQRLASAVGSGAPALPIPHFAISLTTASMITEGAAIALVVGAIGATAIVATAPERSHVPATTTASASVAVVPNRVIATVPLASEAPAAVGSVPVAPARAAALSSSQVLPAAAVSEPSAPAKPTSTLDEELQLIAQAKRQIDHNQPHLAQVWLDEHRLRFPSGVLSAERDGLEVLMACREPDSTAARARAQAYASRYPGSPTLDRIRRACFRDPERDISK